jgi:hypothetical protein
MAGPARARPGASFSNRGLHPCAKTTKKNRARIEEETGEIEKKNVRVFALSKVSALFCCDGEGGFGQFLHLKPCTTRKRGLYLEWRSSLERLQTDPSNNWRHVSETPNVLNSRDSLPSRQKDDSRSAKARSDVSCVRRFLFIEGSSSRLATTGLRVG